MNKLLLLAVFCVLAASVLAAVARPERQRNPFFPLKHHALDRKVRKIREVQSVIYPSNEARDADLRRRIEEHFRELEKQREKKRAEKLAKADAKH